MNKKSNILVRLLGLLICFAAIWIGSYVFYSLPANDWVRVPVFASAGFVYLVGLAMAIFGKEA